MPLKQCPFEVGQCSVHHAFRCMQGPTISKAFSQARTKWRMRKIQVGYKILRIKNHLALLESIRTLIGIKTNISHSSYSVYAVILTRSSLIFSYFVLYYKFCWNDCSVWAEVNSSQRVHVVVKTWKCSEALFTERGWCWEYFLGLQIIRSLCFSRKMTMLNTEKMFSVMQP